MIDHLKRIAITVTVFGVFALGVYLVYVWATLCDRRHYGFPVASSPFMAMIVFFVWKIVGNCVKSR